MIAVMESGVATRAVAHIDDASCWDELSSIGHHGTNIAYWPRLQDPLLVAWMATVPPAELPGFDAAGAITDVIDAWHHYAESLADDVPGPAWLVEDVLQQLMGWVRITQARQARIELEWVDGDNCKKFHTDQVHIRLLTTYVGPGTWWMPNDVANRDRLGLRGDNEDIVREVSAIREIPTGAISLLKGDAFDRTEPGIIHRSPPIAARGLRRLLLRIDDPLTCGCGTC